MAQQLDYTSAQVISRASATIQYIHLDLRNGGNISIGLLGSEGVLFQANYSGATALSLMTTLNTPNLSVKSLHQRILEKLATDGLLPSGTVSGTPS